MPKFRHRLQTLRVMKSASNEDQRDAQIRYGGDCRLILATPRIPKNDRL
jgi:hypothetical protein